VAAASDPGPPGRRVKVGIELRPQVVHCGAGDPLADGPAAGEGGGEGEPLNAQPPVSPARELLCCAQDYSEGAVISWSPLHGISWHTLVACTAPFQTHRVTAGMWRRGLLQICLVSLSE
jgi:hypothetical protein